MLLPALLNGNKLLAMTPSWSELTPRERKRHLELDSEEDPRRKKTENSSNPCSSQATNTGNWALATESRLGHPHSWELSRTDKSCRYGQPGWQKEVAFSAGCPEAADSKKPNQEKCRAIFNLGVSTPMSPSTEGSVAPLSESQATDEREAAIGKLNPEEKGHGTTHHELQDPSSPSWESWVSLLNYKVLCNCPRAVGPTDMIVA